MVDAATLSAGCSLGYGAGNAHKCIVRRGARLARRRAGAAAHVSYGCADRAGARAFLSRRRAARAPRRARRRRAAGLFAGVCHRRRRAAPLRRVRLGRLHCQGAARGQQRRLRAGRPRRLGAARRRLCRPARRARRRGALLPLRRRSPVSVDAPVPASGLRRARAARLRPN